MTTLKLFIRCLFLLLPLHTLYGQGTENIEFIENKGQWDSRVRYKGDVSNGAVFIRQTGFTVLQHHAKDFAALTDRMHGHDHTPPVYGDNSPLTLRSHSYNVDFVGASPNAALQAEKPAEGVINYYLGDDPAGWASACRVFQAVTIRQIYPGIDVRMYTSGGVMKYDIVVQPGADISRIALKYEGADKLQVRNKELVVSTSVGELREGAPYTYQPGINGRKELVSRYVVQGDIVRFDIRGYDPANVLIIDPALVFCSLSRSTAQNWGYTATYGPDGTFYGGGIVFSTGFPVSPGAFQSTFQGPDGGSSGYDIGIIKLSVNGGSRIFATYIGGSGSEQPHSLVVDEAGNMVMAGRTSSTNYPRFGGGNFNSSSGTDYDIAVTRLATNGNMLASLRIGGTGDDGVNITSNKGNRNSLLQNYGDDGRSEVILDGGGNVYIASSTRSNNFPVTGNVFQPLFGGGGQDGALLKFNPDLSALHFASYLGGSGPDAAYVLALGPAGDIYVAGGTQRGSSPTDFPGNHAGTISASHNNSGSGNTDVDGFVAQISNDGSAIIRSTYIGTSGVDQVYGIQFDRRGFPYIMGQTTGNMPAINAAFVNLNSRHFIAKLQPDLSAYVYRTTFGQSGANLPNISPVAFLVDRCENVYVSGWGGDMSGFPNPGTVGMPVTANAIPSVPDGKDFYFFVLQRNAIGQLYGGYFGQNGGFTDHVDGGTSRFDPNGIIYQAMCANCDGGGSGIRPPTTAGVWAPNNVSESCNLGMVKIRFDLAGVGSQVQSSIGGVPRDTAGCMPLEVVFSDQVRNAQQYIWNFGDDGNGPVDPADPANSGLNEGPFPAATGYTRSHTFNNVGTYRVMLIAIDPASCNEMDTSFIHIRVGDLRANLQANLVKLEPCTAFNYRFDNLSTTDPSRPFTNTSFTWDFGDGSPRVTAGMNSVNHTYANPGTYNVRLVLNDTAYCNDPDSLQIELRVAANVVASFQTPPAGCAPYEAVFNNTSVGGASFEWDFGDGNTSTASSPVHTYTVPGTYRIRLVANDPNTCNLTDTAYFQVIVADKPTAAFTYTPVVPVENTENVFTNQSSPDAVRFKWFFGDGDSVVTTSRADVRHQYNSTGTFEACLVAYNAQDCPDTVCQMVSTIVIPALDVPNAFTPNSNDINSVVRVRGFGIAKMRFIIWNRWGQKVFETSTRSEGWDGKVKGVVQPMDVYAYTLDVEFFDGTKATKKGDITLIR